MTTADLRPVTEIVTQVRRDHAESLLQTVAYMQKATEEHVQQIIANRPALEKLEAAGFNLNLEKWMSGANVTLQLGFFHNSKAGNRQLAKQVRAVRLALGCRLGTPQKEPAENKKTMTFRLCPESFPGISVTFQRKIPKGARCRLVVERTTHVRLVCDA